MFIIFPAVVLYGNGIAVECWSNTVVDAMSNHRSRCSHRKTSGFALSSWNYQRFYQEGISAGGGRGACLRDLCPLSKTVPCGTRNTSFFTSLTHRHTQSAITYADVPSTWPICIKASATGMTCRVYSYFQFAVAVYIATLINRNGRRITYGHSLALVVLLINACTQSICLSIPVVRSLHCALSLAAQCIVIGPVCLCVCFWACGSVTTIIRNPSIFTKLGL